MERVTEADIQAIEQQLSQRLIQQLGLNLRTLVYDGTNFFTYINTRTSASLPGRKRANGPSSQPAPTIAPSMTVCA